MKANKPSHKNKLGIITLTTLAVALVFTFIYNGMVSTSQASGTATICHRVGGTEVTINVPDGGTYGGHIPNHTNDSVGACASDVNGNVNFNSSSFQFDTPGSQMKHFRED